MARETDEQLLARFAARQVPNTSLYARGGAVTPPRRHTPPQAKQTPAAAPQAPRGRAKGSVAAMLQQEAAARQAPQEAGGGGNFLQKAAGKVFGNEAVQTVLKPFQVLSYPGAAVASTIKELTDVAIEPLVAEGEWQGDGSFDIGDLWKNTKDNKQFSELIVEPNWDAGPGWLKAGIGFVGDVASDPLTYLTMGSTAFAGKAGRRALARAGYEAGFDAEQLARAAKGVSYLNKEERAALGIERAGLYVGRPSREAIESGKGWTGRIAGTEKIGTALGKGTSTISRGVGKLRPWHAVSTQPERIAEAAAVLNGSSKAMSHAQAAAVVAFDEVYRGTQKTIAAEGERAAHYAFKGMDDGARRTLTHATEHGGESVLRPINQRMMELAKEHGVEIGDLGDNYMTHMLTPEARDFILGPSKQAEDLRQIFRINQTDAQGVALSRRLKAGTHKIGGTTVDLGDGSIADIEKGLQRAFKDAGVVKWMEDDAAKLMAHSINSMAENIGRVAAFKHLATVRKGEGAVRWLDDVADDVLKGVADATDNKAMRDALEAELARRDDMLKIEKKAAKQNAKKLQESIVARIKTSIDERAVVDSELKSKIDALANSPDGKALASLRGEIGRTAAKAKKQLATERANIEAQIADLDKQIDAAAVAAATGAADPLHTLPLQEKRVRLESMRAAGQQAEAELDQLTTDLAGAVHISEQLAAQADDPDFVNGLLADMDDADRASTALAQMDDLAAQQAPMVAKRDEIAARIAEVDAKAAEQYREIDQLAPTLDAMQRMLQGDRAFVQSELKDLRALRNRTTAIQTQRNGFQRALDEFEAVAAQLPDDPELAPIVALLDSYAQQVGTLTAKGEAAASANAFLTAAKQGKLKTVFEQEAERGWTTVADELLPANERIAVQEELAQYLNPLIEMNTTGELWRTVEKMTQFFKTYATATPGFHVRNAMSAAFMNATEGVGLKRTVEAIAEWKKFRKNPTSYLADVKANKPELYDAWVATFGSGAGGNFSADELELVNSKWFNNIWTRNSRKAGEWVEGPARLALALDTTAAGGTMQDALTRVSRIHFDYSQVSQLDRTMKRFIPFWTFMSRNLPLQMQQIFMRPKMYSIYNSLRENVSAGNEFEGMPKWLADQNPMALGPAGTDGDQHVLSPDLPHLNIAGDVNSFNPRDNPLRALSNLNPILVSPLEAISNRDFYYDSDLEGNPLAHVARSIFSPIAQSERLLGVGPAEGKQKEKLANFFGIPYHKITQEQIAREMQRRAQS